MLLIARVPARSLQQEIVAVVVVIITFVFKQGIGSRRPDLEPTGFTENAICSCLHDCLNFQGFFTAVMFLQSLNAVIN
jgi:hypothetical protein